MNVKRYKARGVRSALDNVRAAPARKAEEGTGEISSAALQNTRPLPASDVEPAADGQGTSALNGAARDTVPDSRIAPATLLPVADGTAEERTPSARFRWPHSPYATRGREVEYTEPEPCRIMRSDGSELVARVIQFMPERAVLQYKVPSGHSALTLPFDALKTLWLLRPLTWTDAPPSTGRDGLPASREDQVYSLYFTDGDVLTGNTLGYVRASFGVFLFERGDDPTQIQRLFVPRSAIREFSVGGAGHFLVQENAPVERAVEPAADKARKGRPERAGEQLVQAPIVTPLDLLRAIQHQQFAPVLRLGEALIELGLMSSAQLQSALDVQRTQRSKPLGRILIEQGVLSVESLQLALARKLGVPLVQIDRFPIEEDALRAIPYSVAKRLRLIPLMIEKAHLLVALEDPWRTEALDELRFMTQMKVVPVMAPEGSLEATLRRRYFERRAPAAKFTFAWGPSAEPADVELPSFEHRNVNEIASELNDQHAGEEAEGQQAEDRPVEESDNALVRLVNSMVLDAYQQEASDIHIETYPDQQRTRVRFRKDGLLVPYIELPARNRKALVSRIKVMAGLDIAERRKPQDGKIDFSRYAPARLELRVATIPTTNGLEDVVMRILVSARALPMGQLGLSDANLKRVQSIMTRPFGLFLLAGPTGSGKTTTLHSCLSYINVPERKIWTAEDPIEITQPGLRQVQVLPKIGWTFAAAMRSFLRADPDVIMVGEMRDTETAKIGVEASLTGHLVLSTLHTNGSAESVTRLLDMGLDPFNFSDSLLGVLAQRLVRRLCPNCCEPRMAAEDEIEELVAEYCFDMPDLEALKPERIRAEWRERFGDTAGRIKLYHAPGCENCYGTGYKGRFGIHELLVASLAIKRIVQTGGRIEDIRRVAFQQGTRTLKQDGIEKILRGLTDLLEVRSASN